MAANETDEIIDAITQILLDFMGLKRIEEAIADLDLNFIKAK